MDVGEWELLGRVALAAVLGLAIGLDRELKSRPAGLRTHALVALGAAGFMAASVLISQELVDSSSGVTLDQSRIAAGVVAGVGFLGAGAIIRTRGHVLGLTTAAGIWATAAVGILAGAGFYIAAVGITVVTVVTQVVVLRIADIIEIRTSGPDEETSSGPEDER